MWLIHSSEYDSMIKDTKQERDRGWRLYDSVKEENGFRELESERIKQKWK